MTLATASIVAALPRRGATSQTRRVSVSLSRAFDSIGGLRFPGVGVDLSGAVVSGQFAIVGAGAIVAGCSGGLGNGFVAGRFLQQFVATIRGCGRLASRLHADSRASPDRTPRRR